MKSLLLFATLLTLVGCRTPEMHSVAFSRDVADGVKVVFFGPGQEPHGIKVEARISDLSDRSTYGALVPQKNGAPTIDCTNGEAPLLSLRRTGRSQECGSSGGSWFTA
jgi:hypothetical protein